MPRICATRSGISSLDSFWDSLAPPKPCFSWARMVVTGSNVTSFPVTSRAVSPTVRLKIAKEVMVLAVLAPAINNKISSITITSGFKSFISLAINFLVSSNLDQIVPVFLGL